MDGPANSVYARHVFFAIAEAFADLRRSLAEAEGWREKFCRKAAVRDRFGGRVSFFTSCNRGRTHRGPGGATRSGDCCLPVSVAARTGEIGGVPSVSVSVAKILILILVGRSRRHGGAARRVLLGVVRGGRLAIGGGRRSVAIGRSLPVSAAVVPVVPLVTLAPLPSPDRQHGCERGVYGRHGLPTLTRSWPVCNLPRRNSWRSRPPL
uniref:Uncharacterized protein n=1 Tax=Plectus sambesii TaxID=2011161 RepID=A0A914VLU3_9BILA